MKLKFTREEFKSLLEQMNITACLLKTEKYSSDPMRAGIINLNGIPIFSLEINNDEFIFSNIEEDKDLPDGH